MLTKQRLLSQIDDVLAKAERAVEGARADSGVAQGHMYHLFLSSAQHLIHQLGPHAAPWLHSIRPLNATNITTLDGMRGSILALKEAVERGDFETWEVRLTNAVLGDLVEQARALIDSNYFLAAGVILRAVLEERLRKLCGANSCMPAKARPMINDYKLELRKKDVIDVAVEKEIDWMNRIGSEAAHNLAEFKPTDVPLLYDHIVAFLARFAP